MKNLEELFIEYLASIDNRLSNIEKLLSKSKQYNITLNTNTSNDQGLSNLEESIRKQLEHSQRNTI